MVLLMCVIVVVLVIGNVVVYKFDFCILISGGIIIVCVFEEVGLFVDLLYIVFGGVDVGVVLCEDLNIVMVLFIGLFGVGVKVGEVCGCNLKKVQLELGGKNVLIILDDVDIDVVVLNVVWGVWLY